MRPFTRVEGVAVAVARPNIDTDLIIPIHRLVDHPPEELGPFLFEAWRYGPDGAPDPTFVMNQPRYAEARVLVAGENFGCGSSREHAVWALGSFGIRCVVAPSFGDIFRQNCYQNGLLPVALPSTVVDDLIAEIESVDHRPVVSVDLEALEVTSPTGRRIGFDVEADRRRALLDGLDDIGQTLTLRRRIEAFEALDEQQRPWNYRAAEEAVTQRLLVLAGDGVGAEVMPQARRVLEWFTARGGLEVDVHEELFGIAAWREHGTLMRDETWAEIEAADAILFGAIGAPEYDEVPAADREVDWLLEIRRSLDLFLNLRPVRTLDALLDSSTLRPEAVRGVDMVLVRELAGGVYFGEPRGVVDLADGTRRAFNTTVYSTPEIERIARAAFELARTRDGRVCSVDKANVLEVGAFWRETVGAVHAAEYPDIELRHMYVDNCAMQLVRDPRQFDVVLTENLFGDILSDCAAMLTGSLGMLPSASLGPPGADGRRAALYEPIHGSAPDIAGHGIANPLGAILSLGLCLRHSLDRPQDAILLERAVESALDGGARTRDLVPASSTVEALSSAAMTDAVLAELERLDTQGPVRP